MKNFRRNFSGNCKMRAERYNLQYEDKNNQNVHLMPSYMGHQSQVTSSLDGHFAAAIGISRLRPFLPRGKKREAKCTDIEQKLDVEVSVVMLIICRASFARQL